MTSRNDTPEYSKAAGRRVDPLVYLNDELMVHIFSYVGGQLAKATPSSLLKGSGGSTSTKKEEDEEEYVEEEVTDEEAERIQKEQQKKSQDEEDQFLDVFEAGKFYYNLARVSRDWKRIIDNALPLLATSISLLSNRIGIRCMEWLGRHKLSLGRILIVRNPDFLANVNYKHYDPQPPLITMLQQCQTNNLKMLDIHVWHGIPAAGEDCRTQQPRQFLDEIAQQCPNLKSCTISLHSRDAFGISSTDASLISPTFFSLAHLETLRLGFEMDSNLPLDPTIVSTMVQNLPSLQYLFLDSFGRPTLGGDPIYTTFAIRSPSLKQVLVENFTKHVRLALDCPKLQVFRCKGFMGHSQNPQQQQLQRIAVQQQVIKADTVPENCLGLVIHVCNPYGPPIGFPFHQLLGPNVSLLPLRNHHG